jgi:hypothetical protein
MKARKVLFEARKFLLGRHEVIIFSCKFRTKPINHSNILFKGDI